MIRNFKEILEMVKSYKVPPVLGVVSADQHSIEAVISAKKLGLIQPILFGNEIEIQKIINEIDKDLDLKIVNIDPNEDVAKVAVKYVKLGHVNALMKGNIETSDLLKAVVDKEYGLNTGRLMTHVVLNEVPGIHKILLTTDGGMVMYPTLDQKKKIIENAVEVLHQIGYKNPKVACVAAVEKVNPKMPETIDADSLKKMNQNGEISGCMVEGPISLDLALSDEIAKIKRYDSPVAGDADIIIVPNITVGNVLGKSITVLAKGKMAGIIYGAKVPIILTSRGSSTEEKMNSIAFASLIKMED